MHQEPPVPTAIPRNRGSDLISWDCGLQKGVSERSFGGLKCTAWRKCLIECKSTAIVLSKLRDNILDECLNKLFLKKGNSKQRRCPES